MRPYFTNIHETLPGNKIGGENMLRKFVGVVFSALLISTFGTQAFAAEVTPDSYAKALQAIEKTNSDIEAKIAKAVKDSDSLEAQYLQDVQKIEEGDTVVKLKDQKNKLEDDLSKTNDPNKIIQIKNQLADLNSKLEAETAKIQSKIDAIQSQIAELQLFTFNDDKDVKKIDDKIAKLNAKIVQKEQKYMDRTSKFTNDLDKLIDDLYDTTLKMSNETIKKASDQGIQAETSWVLVELGGRMVWIDPIRVCH
jgi:peptidoglycan hydrolase CwlO-like protein